MPLRAAALWPQSRQTARPGTDGGQIQSAINSDSTFKRNSIASDQSRDRKGADSPPSSNKQKLILAAVLTMLSLGAGIASAAGISGSSDASSVRHIYMKHCAQCHGKSGKGDGPRAAHLMTQIHSFADCEWMSMRSNAILFLAIKNGSAAVGMLPEMPPFDGRLDNRQITDLIWYVRSFCTGGTRADP